MATHQSLWGSLVYLLAHYGWQYVSSYGVALRIGVLSFVGGVALAFVLTTLRVSPIPPLRAAISFYVEVFRNIPVLALLIFIVFALPEVGLVIDYEPSVIVTLILVASAFGCDALRSGINAIDPGQVEAARSLGLTFFDIVSSIIMPQALRTVVQPMVTLFISVIVSSSTGAMVPLAHTELTGLVNQINTKDALGIPTFFVAAMFYVCTGLVIAAIGRFLEKKVALCR
ncbi:amino acid ABC transporter permease [Bifidobacterium sp. ESL0732]|uniref:amino acid ABC transporter permease n=1 Tax=Bifidobacterium sp. ESL0732 TaxID=2983222 RepID=UPI0023F70C76|nr:amino acid ABC transporter permease [Bifidobacterium sp. ESL0732]WEV64068.1 amino acid ABC transporter permease [Bifidobacterium sp. ESL0732]